MRDFQNVNANDGYTRFDKELAGQIIIMVGEKLRRNGEE